MLVGHEYIQFLHSLQHFSIFKAPHQTQNLLAHCFFGYNFIIFDCTLWHVGSLFLNQELNSTHSLQWKYRVLSTGPEGKFQHFKSVFTFITYFDSHNILKRYNYPHNMTRNARLWEACLPWLSAQPSSSNNWQSPQEPSFCLISWLFGP